MSEYRLSYTATEIDEKLGKIDELVAADNAITTQINEVINSGGIGYAIKNVINFQKSDNYFNLYDLDYDFHSFGLDDVALYKVCDYTIAIGDGVSISIVEEGNKTTQKYSWKIMNFVQDSSEMAYLRYYNGGNINYPLVVVLDGHDTFGTGTWFAYVDDNNYMESVDFGDTIHTISEKFLPINYQNLPQRVRLLETGGELVEKKEYAVEQSGEFGIITLDPIELTSGMLLTVHFDGVDYECITISVNDDIIAFGNFAVAGETNDTGEPFCGIYSEDGFGMVVRYTATTHVVGIYSGTNKNKLPEGGYGYTEENVLTFDGNNEGKVNLGDETQGLIRIGDVIDPYEITEVHLLYDGNPMVLTADQLSILEFGGCAEISFNGEKGIYIFPEGMDGVEVSGTYVISIPSMKTYISRIVLAEIVHKIDQKYLPVHEETLIWAKAYSDSKGGYVTTEIAPPLLKFILTKESNGTSSASNSHLNKVLYKGKSYFVTTDSGTFEAVCKEQGSTYLYIGNMALMNNDYEDTGENFVYYERYDTANPVAIDANCGSTLSISDGFELVETIHPFETKYLPKGGVGYTEPIVFTFDGNIEGKTMFVNSMVKVSDEIPDLSTFVKVCGYIKGKYFEGNASQSSIFNDSGYDTIYVNNIAIAIAVFDESVGTETGLYVACQAYLNNFVSYIEFDNAIHTIDHKYLPNTVPNIESAEIGQVIVVKAVDENGKPIEWEAVDLRALIAEILAESTTNDN